jgi:ATP phosphoribosyltransferase
VPTDWTSRWSKTTPSLCKHLRDCTDDGRIADADPKRTLTASVFLPAADIPRFVALGSVALGITGQDVIAESTHADQITELLPLGFGKCSLQVQVPVSGPLQTIEQLSGGRIATSFEVLAGELFKQVDDKVGKGKTQVEYVGGSVEAACALGMADGIGASAVNPTSRSALS